MPQQGGMPELVGAEHKADGRFVRQGDAFRGWVSAEGQTEHPVATGRYHLYVAYGCPWSHRIILVRQLLGLEGAIGMTAVDPLRGEEGWTMRDEDGRSRDPVNSFTRLSEAYLATDPSYQGRSTVPVLWDKQAGRVVSNSDDDLMRMFGTEFRSLARTPIDLYPAAHRAEIDELAAWLHETVNNGVYKAGFATAQGPYEAAVRQLFEALDALETRLAGRRFLVADEPTEVDWRLYVTLVRFDPVYYSLFKCNLRRIADYPHLSRYLRALHRIPGVAETTRVEEIKQMYYGLPALNPSGIVPLGPHLAWENSID